MEQLFTFGLTNALTAALLALAAAAIARFSRRPALWYALWLVVLLRFLAPPIFAFDLEVPDFGRPAAESTAALVEVGGGDVGLVENESSLDPLAVIGGLWAAGAMVVLGFALAQSIHLRQILAASNAAPDGLGSRVADLAGRLGLRRAPPTVVVDDRVPPMLWAFLGSVRLILPSELLTRLEPAQTDTLLAHELAHLKRRDHWVRHLELAALALFWWNPIAWWATHRLRRAQELCCDQRVAELLPAHRRSYADTLVETARFLSGRRLPLGSPARAMADLSQMKGRIRMIMTDSPTPKMSVAVRLAAAAILLGVLAVTPILTATPGESDFTGRPIDLVLEEADLDDVLATFSKLSAVEILVESGVSGKVTANFEQVPWDEALFTILSNQNLTWERAGDQIIVRRSEGKTLVPVRPADGEPPARLAGKLDGAEVYRYKPDAQISEPVAIEKTPPKYPPEARKAKVSGVVVADLVIDEVGVVRDVLVQESPSDELSNAAIEALEQWRFQPAMMNGKPVAVRYIVTIKFNLQ
jgi:TonB family protein